MHAITGITGQVGGAVAHTLLAEGANVRAVARDAGKAAPWQERGCELANCARPFPALSCW
ncbi:MAG TPA: NAD-dependent epimerase/dehydratase family protein [Acetobacteraceae bacterium]|nr:NAD-dependent epimerase/dehydratase family protein [Acetobacteraceae bacterium]